MSTLYNFVSKNAVQVDAKEEESKQRAKYPLLFHPDEEVVLSFTDRGGKGRDKVYFTTKRFLYQDVKGVGGKRKNYLSVPYETIEAFKTQTAGAGLDGDSEVRIWSTGKEYTGVDFAAGKVDLFAVQQFLSSKIDWRTDEKKGETIDPVNTSPPNLSAEDRQTAAGKFFEWIGDNATQISAQDAEQQLKVKAQVLLADEKVELAYRCGYNGRDLTVCTNKRFLSVDAQGIFGKKVAFTSVKWNAIHAYSVETAGAYFDRDTELKVFTNISTMKYIEQDFRKAHADLWAIKCYLNNKLLGEDTQPLPNTDRKQGHVDPKTSWWFRDNQRPLDCVEMERYYKDEIPILQGDEVVEYAFKGRRDITLFTTKRYVDIDPKGWKGQKVEYTSVPWSNVIAFGAKTAGKYLDTDCEVRLWTEMYMKPSRGEDDPPEPKMSFLEVDFNKNLVDVTVLKRYLAERLLGTGITLPIQMDALVPSAEAKGFEKFLSKIGGDARTIDHSDLNRELHTKLPLLLDSENIVMAFKGLSGQSIAYDSIPYISVRAFSAESAGDWDRDSDLKVFTKNRWNLSEESFDFRKGKADIVSIQKFLSAVVLGSASDAAKFTESTHDPSKTYKQSMKGFLAWIESNSLQVDADTFDMHLHSDPPVLLDEERVQRAFKQGRDLYLYTTHRILIVDVQGLGGKKVEYKSFPLKHVHGFSVESAGHLDRDAELYLHLDIPAKKDIKQSILVKSFDIMEMHKYWTERILFPPSH